MKTNRNGVFEAMEELRADGWCVVLKCLPKELGWLIEGSRSEYDAPCPDQYVGAGKWLCEIQDMRRTGKWRLGHTSMDESPAAAVSKVVELVKEYRERA